jgi:hypothetical protein
VSAPVRGAGLLLSGRALRVTRRWSATLADSVYEPAPHVNRVATNRPQKIGGATRWILATATAVAVCGCDARTWAPENPLDWLAASHKDCALILKDPGGARVSETLLVALERVRIGPEHKTC